MNCWQVLDHNSNVERIDADDLAVSIAGALVFTNALPYALPDQPHTVVTYAFAPGYWTAVNLMDADQ